MQVQPVVVVESFYIAQRDELVWYELLSNFGRLSYLGTSYDQNWLYYVTYLDNIINITNVEIEIKLTADGKIVSIYLGGGFSPRKICEYGRCYLP